VVLRALYGRCDISSPFSTRQTPQRLHTSRTSSDDIIITTLEQYTLSNLLYKAASVVVGALYH
jgi:hypothetical protein